MDDYHRSYMDDYPRSNNRGYGHFFKGVFSENTLYTFSRFQKFDKILLICICCVRFRS